MSCPVIRAELPPLPARVAKLPVDRRGYPVPWFVSWIDGEPEFRAMDGDKLVAAVQQKRCWVCGEPLGSFYAFVIGPMCAINHISAEPPSHRECAEFSAIACPFLSRPHMRRRANDLPDEIRPAAGLMIPRNPGVALVWITKEYKLVRPSTGGVLFQVGRPRDVLCYAEGRRATADEIRASIDSGYPILHEQAKQDGIEAVSMLEKQAVVARRLLGVA